MHHRQEGQVLTHPQEEAALIGGLALLWIGESHLLMIYPQLWGTSHHGHPLPLKSTSRSILFF